MAAPIKIANSAAQLEGKTVLTAEDGQIVTGAISFQRAPTAPFDVQTGSAVVPHLDADLLDGEEGADYHDASQLSSGTVPTARLPNPLPAFDAGSLTNLSAAALTGVVPNSSIPDPLPAVSGENLTDLDATALVGVIPDGAVPDPLPAVSAENLTDIPAANLTGTVDEARLPGTVKAAAADATITSTVNAVETDLLSFVAAEAEIAALGEGFEIEAGGALGANTNSKTLKLYIGAISATLLTNAANVAGNRWQLRLRIARSAATEARVSGTLSYGAANGAAATVLHFGGLSMTGLSGWGGAQTIKLTGQGTASADIQVTDFLVKKRLL